MKLKKGLKRLPKSNNGVKRDKTTMAVYKYQKQEIQRQANARGMCVSYYMNWLLWRDWLSGKTDWNTVKGKLES